MCTDQWNIIEGHGRMMTKGNEVGKEYYLRRIVMQLAIDEDRRGAEAE